MQFIEEQTAGEETERPLVLVVEDDEHDWRMYGELLWYNGFDVMHASSGKTGLELALSRRPSLILLDLVLPELSGLEVCRRLKAHPDTEEIPVIILTGRPDYAADAWEAGCKRFLEKPLSPLEVLYAVEHIVGRPPPAGEGRLPEKGPMRVA